VGEKTAAALVSRFGPVEEIVAAAQRGDDGFPAGSANRIRAAADYLLVAPGAVRGRTDAPVGEIVDDIPAEPRDPKRLAELVDELGIANSVARLQRAIANAVGQ
jgi:5'-3' exonuclease